MAARRTTYTMVTEHMSKGPGWLYRGETGAHDKLIMNRQKHLRDRKKIWINIPVTWSAGSIATS